METRILIITVFAFILIVVLIADQQTLAGQQFVVAPKISPLSPLVSPSPPIPIVVCGDGRISGAEQCDDSNTDNGDGCSATCRFEAGYMHVCTSQELDAVRTNLSGHYIQTCDINLTGFSLSPIGGTGAHFIGIYNGNSHIINHYTYANPSLSFVGLFGIIDNNAKLVNVHLEDYNIVGYYDVGGLVGSIGGNSMIIDSFASGTVQGSGSVGGIVGGMEESSRIEGTTIESIVFNTVSGDHIGGFVGLMQGETVITDSQATATVNAADTAGGFAGSLHDFASIDDSKVTGSVTGSSSLGGFVSSMTDDTSITFSSAAVTVTSSGGLLGGFVSLMDHRAMITDSSATGQLVQGTTEIGGFAGSMDGPCVLRDVSATVSTVIGTGNHVGGIVGEISGYSGAPLVEDAAATGTISGNNNVGGLVGHVEYQGTVTASSFTGSVNGVQSVGGLVGRLDGDDYYGASVVQSSFASATVTGTDYIGGAVGTMGSGLFYGTSDPLIENVYILGHVSGANKVGGAAGQVRAPSFGSTTATIRNTYAATTVSGTTDVGGFVGQRQKGTFVGDHWDNSVAGPLLDCGSGTCSGIQNHPTAAMHQQATFTGWDFVSVWDIIEGQTYPYLQWQDNP